MGSIPSISTKLYYLHGKERERKTVVDRHVPQLPGENTTQGLCTHCGRTAWSQLSMSLGSQYRALANHQVRLLNIRQCSLPCNVSPIPIDHRFSSYQELGMKPVLFENIRTRERLVCDDLRNVTVIDGEEYLAVRREQEQRVFLTKRSILTQVKVPRRS